jgi:uncharacterized protein YPO0396
MLASIKAALESARAELEKLAAEATGEARKQIEAALQRVTEAETQIKGLVTKYEQDIEATVEADLPTAKTELESLGKKLVADVLAILASSGV